MVEFAFVVVLLIALLYGIISYGLILAAQSTITQAAADGARAGHRRHDVGAVTTAEGQACHRRGLDGQGVRRPRDFSTATCTFSPITADAITAFACQRTALQT